MPRLSVAQRNKLKAELLENDDDDDDDILKPSLLHPSNRSVSPQTNNETIEKTPEKVEKIFTEKEIEQQAMKNAQDAIERVLSIKCFPKISKATDLKWLRTGQKIWPVFVSNDPSHAELLKVEQGKKQIIEYIGNHLRDKTTIQAVLPRSLSDYHNSNDEQSWNPDSMAAYTKQLKRYKLLVGKKGQELQQQQKEKRMILEEQFFLELLLKKQLEMDETVVETDANNDDKDEDENEEEFTYTASEETITVTPPTPPSTPGSRRRSHTDRNMNAQCQKLRAGDIIEYIHPVFLSRQKAMILRAMPPSASRKHDNDTVLFLSDAMALQRETEVRLVKRFLRGTLVDNPGAEMMFLWDFKLDASQNGKFKESDFDSNSSQEKSMAEKMQDAYDEANDQVEQEIMKLARTDSDGNNEENEEQQSGKKRTRQEASEPFDQEANQRTPSCPRL